MTFNEWSDELKFELTKAGFEVESYSGFPFVPERSVPTFEQKKALIEFECALPMHIRLYKEGALFTPHWPATMGETSHVA